MWCAGCSKRNVPVADFADYAQRDQTRREHAVELQRYLGLRRFGLDDWRRCLGVGADTAWATDRGGRSLQKLKGFGLRRGCNVWIVAHPTKMKLGEGGVIPPPGPYDISGSANWANKPDVGLTVHNPDNKATTIILWKSRFARRWGPKGGAAELEFDAATGRYQSPMDIQIKYGPDAWNDMRRKEDQTPSEDYP
jgi:hypothetical protein